MSDLLAIVSPQIEQAQDWWQRYGTPDGSWIWAGSINATLGRPITRFVLAWEPLPPKFTGLFAWSKRRKWERSVYPLIREKLIARGAVDITRLIYL